MSPGQSLDPRAPQRRGAFTLVELLVVVLIIGILAAIALPRLLGQRTRAKNAAAQAAARHALVAARSYYTQNSETYAGLGPSELRGYESSLSGTEPADTVKPGDSSANPQDIWIGNGAGASNPASGDANSGNTVVLCSVSRGDTVYCVKDVNGVASYYSFTGGAVLAGADGSLYTANGWSSASSLTAPTAGTPTVSGTATVGSNLSGAAGTWSGTTASTTWNWVWRRCDSSGASCADIAGASGSATGSAAPTITAYPLVSADSGNTIRLQVQAQNGGSSCNVGSNCASATSTQTAVVAGSLTVDYLLVGGGGASANSVHTAGGAGGGVLSGSTTVNAGTHTITVGAGATVGQASGGNSSAFSLTALGGGSGGMAGGSGGGAHTSGSPGAGTAGQGFAGGNGATDNTYYWLSGGGGGAGGVGGAAVAATRGGNGGPGIASSITGSSVTYAGGGGGGSDGGYIYTPSLPGGSGGAGGGGNGGGNGTAPGTGTNGLGGGGGGRGVNGGATGGNGGSGVVIIRYLTSSGITATGGTITVSGAYRVHTFTSSGSFSF